jgi:hypothetical protein
MKKIYLMLMAILLIGGVSALIVTSDGYILNRDEMASVNDNVIASYMVNTFGLADYKIIEDKIITYYNITYLESSQGINPETNKSETQYRVFTQYKPFIIQKNLWNECTNLTTQAACIDILVNRETPFVYVTQEATNETEEVNRTITSTYYQAKQEQLRQYERAKAVRDNAINNELDYLFENIE